MLNTIVGALLPMIVTFLLGYVAAWRHDFGSKPWRKRLDHWDDGCYLWRAGGWIKELGSV